MPPPPLAWQPAQLYQPNRRCPSESAYALFSYGLARWVVSTGTPGCSALTRIAPFGVALGGVSRKRRSSRLQLATASAATASRMARCDDIDVLPLRVTAA